VRLARVLEGLAILEVRNHRDVEIAGVAYDSRRVNPGDLFCAIPGARTDGHRYCEQALDRGAVALLVERWGGEFPVPTVRVEEARGAMALGAANLFDRPARKLRVIGVTGTKGKTTTTFLLRAVLESAGIRCGLVGTVVTVVGGRPEPIERTTPEAPDLQQLLARMVEADDQAVVMEVSSHALAMSRVVGCEFDTAVFTNLGRDHLDFHGNMEAYRDAKLKLFTEHLVRRDKPGRKTAVVNRDDPAGEHFLRATRVPALTYGLGGRAMVRAEQVELGRDGSSFLLRAGYPGQPEELSLPVAIGAPGRYNVYNALAAITGGMAEDLHPRDMVEVLAKGYRVPGRLEPVDEGQDFVVLVDYAHTPDSLENVLRAVREFASGRIILVFGCGGDRDRGKRPLMGRVAVDLADQVVVTSDNPRGEDPQTIIAEILAGVQQADNSRVHVEADRRLAIRRAITMAHAGDTVVIAGKGHETYQEIGGAKFPLDDREEAREAIAERQSGQP
jgi:UDP-N-acetylmuramoyl-L-alanyl-D-glutamate--2,6-diaminopimelate ligase